MLNYASSRRVFRPGDTLAFDPAYRLAHLPLVAPRHPASIRAVPGQDYRDGTYLKPRYSLVAPIRSRDLTASPAFQALEAELRAASFAPKFAWDLGERRAAKLHATVVNGLQEANVEACAAAVTRTLARLGPLSFRLGGPFVGNKNLGRIYFPVYPQAIDGDNSFGVIQDAVGGARTRFYVAGYYNLVDELDAAETADLARVPRTLGPGHDPGNRVVRVDRSRDQRRPRPVGPPRHHRRFYAAALRPSMNRASHSRKPDSVRAASA